MPARRSELAGFHLSLPQTLLTFQPQLNLAELAPLLCEVASLMVLQALRKAFCVTELPIDARSFALALRQGPHGV